MPRDEVRPLLEKYVPYASSSDKGVYSGYYNGAVTNVDSSVILMRKKEKILDVIDMNLFKKIVRDSFMYKRKNIRNNLKKYDLILIEEVLKKYGFDLSIRAENLSLEIFVDIANNLSQ